MDPKKDDPDYELVEDSEYEVLDEKGEPISAGAPTIAVDREDLKNKPQTSPKAAPPPLTPAPTLPDAARPDSSPKSDEAPKIKIQKKPASAPPKIEITPEEIAQVKADSAEKIKIELSDLRSKD